MTTISITLFLLLALLHTIPAPAQAKPDPLQSCPSTTCGSGSIRYPLRLRSAPASCGIALTCSADNTALLSLPHLPPLEVTAVDYQTSTLTVLIGSGFGSLSSPCPLRNLTSFSFSFLKTPPFTPANPVGISLISCLEKFEPGAGSGMIAGPIACLSGSGSYVYAVGAEESMEVVPAGCLVVARGGEIPYRVGFLDEDGARFAEIVEGFEKKREVSLKWDLGEVGDVCANCEGWGGVCGFDLEKNRSVCEKSKNPGLPVKIITGTSISGFIILGAVSFIFYYIFRQTQKEKETRLKVERFLATYKTTKPTRYTYSGIKKITKQFRHKLGQGGFGSVYKGELPNGIPVAVKMLEKSKGDADEFINEVATMGRIHHVNVVHLLGFCSEGTRHALVYEFMPNESLEKFIFSEEARRSDQSFSLEKLQDIAIGIARGIEYLHQGCNQRILHFDIKPHNILLDHNFIPKISDFGLAKLCSKDQSIITMTAARGTMGYIAPEIYSRNFGTVSYKSDVYSFGMLLLEMVSGRRNVDPAIENRNEVYFPEWIYDRLVHGEDLGLVKQKGKEDDIVKMLVIVSLWCIQWSPTNRPTMSRVVQLLTGNLESLQIPPKPFVSSSDQDDDTSVDVVVDSENSNEHAVP